MRLTSGLLLAAALIPGCASPGAVGPIPGDPWTPPPGALALAGRLGSGDPAERAAAEEALAALDEEGRISVLRAGLRLPDGPAAVACAGRLEWAWIDVREAARSVAILTPTVFRVDSAANFEEFRSYLGSDELGPVLETLLPESPGAASGEFTGDGLSALHRVVRAEHFPLLCRLAVHPDEGIRDGAFDCMHTALDNTDRFREEFARVLLAHWQDRLVEGPEVPPEDGSGYPVLLREVLRHAFVERGATATVERWALRWMNDRRPGPGDVELLLAMEETGLLPGYAEFVLLLALGDLRDEATGALLDSRLDPSVRILETDLSAAALHAAVRRGRAGAMDRLLVLARENHSALVLLADLAPAAAAAILREFLLARDPEAAAAARRWAEDCLWTGETLDRPLPEGIFDGLEEAALAAGLDGGALARLGTLHPALATRRIARAAVEDLRRREFPAVEDGSDASLLPDPREAAFLDIAAPEEFRTLLREWAAAEDGEQRTWARIALLRLGDPVAGPMLAAWVEEGGGEEEGEESPLYLLARIPSPEVEALLRARAAKEPWDAEGLVAYAALHGFQGWSLAGVISDPDETLPDPALRAEFRRLVLEGRPVDALAAVLAARPDHEGGELGAVDDPRVRAHLEGLRDRRAPGKHRHAVEQLALAGDAAAREELWSAYRAGRYRWVDEGDYDTMTLGWDLSTIPFWIGELESNCCRFYKPAWVLDNRFGIDPFDFQKSLAIPADVLRRWWARCGGRLRRSPLAEEFVVGPAD